MYRFHTFIAAFLFISISTISQSSFEFNATSSLSHIDTLGTSVSHTFNFDIVNKTPNDSLKLRWRIQNEPNPLTANSWWQSVNYLIPTINQERTRPFDVGPDTSVTLSIYIDPNETVGADSFVFCVYEREDSVNTINCITVLYSLVDSVGIINSLIDPIMESNESSIRISSNLDYGTMILTSSHKPIKNYEVYDINGLLVHAIGLNPTSIETGFITNELSAGLYLIKTTLEDEQKNYNRLIITK